MSDFLIHAARMQDAGISSLWVSLGAMNGKRVMHVSPDSSVPQELAARFPTRTFELDGTDRKLQDLQDEMAYSDEGPTPEKLMAAIEAYPVGAEDLREWFTDWTLTEPVPSDADFEAIEIDEKDLKRSTRRILDMMKGLDIARHVEASKAHK